MSDSIRKMKRSKRRYDSEIKIKRQTDIAKSHGFAVKYPHKYAKMHSTNCGNPNCAMCGNPRKFFKEETFQERKFKQDKIHIDSDMDGWPRG